MNLKVLLASAALAGALGLATAASATVVNFDDLPDGVVADGYGGVIWGGNWDNYVEPQDHYAPHSAYGRVYADYNLGAGEQGDTNFHFAGPVLFDGAYFSGHGSGEGYASITFGLYLGGVLVHTSGALDPDDTSTFLASGYTGRVDEVRVNGTRDVFVMDDVTYRAVPEPAAWALMIAGFGLAGAALRRRESAAA